ncbi:MAG TPA: transcriptional regulator [Pyrinomonadaceae bacterium]
MAKQSTAKKEIASKREDTTTGPREEKARKSAAPHLDRLIHERLRLGIISALAANESLTFSDLKSLMNTTDGNLSVHARKLEEAGYIACTKYFDGRLPKTEYKLTAAGRTALESYLNHMESLIRQMRSA